MKLTRKDNLVEVKACIGHIIHHTVSCKNCESSEENKQCSHYQSYPAKVGPSHPLHPYYQKEK